MKIRLLVVTARKALYSFIFAIFLLSIIQLGTAPASFGQGMVSGPCPITRTIDLTDPNEMVDLSEGISESNNNVTFFLEQQGVNAPGSTLQNISLPIDIRMTTPQGTTDQNVNLAGVEFNSYIIHYDPVDPMNNTTLVQIWCSLTFNTPILGIQVLNNHLDIGDTALDRGDGKIIHSTSDGLELNAQGSNPADMIIFQSDRMIDLHFGTSNSLDQIRVFTAPSHLSTTVERTCNDEASHKINVEWDVDGLESDGVMEIDIISTISGDSLLDETLKFDVNDSPQMICINAPEGDTVIISGLPDEPAGNFKSGPSSEPQTLEPC